MENLYKKAFELRKMIVELSYKTHTSHLGSSLSCADILLAAYNGGLNISPENVSSPDRDRLVFSKGHAALALVCALAQSGFCTFNYLLENFNQPGGLQEHPGFPYLPGIENASGSLGHGLPLGLGMALAARISKLNYRVCVVMGDGECNEGSIWEAAMLAPALGLNNLCVIVDFNRWQATGRSCEITSLEPLAEKWKSFGWNCLECDGHDPVQLRTLLASFGQNKSPVAIIAHTVKGKGITFMEDDNNWHYRIPNKEELALALKELTE